MKVLIVGDIHWSTYSSILRSRGKHFSTRLESLIKSLSWVEQLSKEQGCEEEIFLGDTFDREDLSAEEITALSEVEWNTSSRIKHFIVGNHESGISTLEYNSTQVLHKLGVIENVPYIYPLDEKTEFLFLPYIVEDNRKPLSEYLKERNTSKKLVVFSHNDIKNFQMGPFLSKTGFDIDEIENNCSLYFNGHLHNCGNVTKKIINIGVLSGQNFSEDAFKYEHHVAILDTDTLEIQYFENPYAINFYKIDITNLNDLDKLKKVKSNAVVSIKCPNAYQEALKDTLQQVKNILTYKIIYTRDLVSQESSSEITLEIGEDHLEQFRKYIIETLGNDEIINEELNEVCGQ